MMKLLRETFNGTISKKRINVGSKSERDALVIEDHLGHEYTLRISEPNAPENKKIDELVGNRVEITGIRNAMTGIVVVSNVADITLLPPSKT